MAIIELTQNNFDDIVTHSHDKVLVYFWAPWCMHCQQMIPTLDWVNNALGHNITIGKINIDCCSNLAQKYSVRSVPTLLLFKDGFIKKRAVGSMDHEQLTSWLY